MEILRVQCALWNIIDKVYIMFSAKNIQRILLFSNSLQISKTSGYMQKYWPSMVEADVNTVWVSDFLNNFIDISKPHIFKIWNLISFHICESITPIKIMNTSFISKASSRLLINSSKLVNLQIWNVWKMKFDSICPSLY